MTEDELQELDDIEELAGKLDKNKIPKDVMSDEEYFAMKTYAALNLPRRKLLVTYSVRSAEEIRSELEELMEYRTMMEYKTAKVREDYYGNIQISNASVAQR